MSNIEKFVGGLQALRGRLFHFTDSRNIESIKQHGLLTTQELRERGIFAITGGDEASLGIDTAKGFDRYVRLSFCRHHPMSHDARERGSIEQLRILRVCPTVLLREGVLLADRVATANESELGPADDMILKMDYEATYRWMD
ncbi:MAG TPA: DarT ssDNA thymidine ADP-ribosyltransferase family protein [Terriglobales bacterium]|nr:DarT ssDNA thymidine ADP-ribosyltransferase family protein [Terriglobales bacterium]